MRPFYPHQSKMHFRWLVAPVVASLMLTIPSIKTARSSTAANQAVASDLPPLSPALPYDVDMASVRSLVGKFGREDKAKVLQAHRLFGELVWQTFIALNWPANDRGQPDLSLGIRNNTRWRVWDFWRTASSIFTPDGSAPKPWSDNLSLATGLRTVADMKHADSIAGPNGTFEAFTGPLVDQHGNWARFEIRVNHEEFDYIVQNNLYSLDGQATFSQKNQDNRVNFPINHDGKHGAIEVKLAWKQLTEQDDASRFYTHVISITPSEPDTKPTNRKFGLVGMHIAMHTKSSPEWIWSTFEQIDNVRSNTNAAGKTSTPSFIAVGSKGPFNVLAPKNATFVGGKLVPAAGRAATTWIESLTTAPVQVKRVALPTVPNLNPLDHSLNEVSALLNREVQALLRKQGSVFQYYELVDVQWPLHPSLPSVAGGEGSAPESLRFKTPGNMIPSFLINTTMETFFQGGLQPAGGSEQDNRLGPPALLLSDAGNKQVMSSSGNSLTDSTMVSATESCAGCHFSAGVATMFRNDASGKRVPVFGENATFGDNGNADYSWMLQLEANWKP